MKYRPGVVGWAITLGSAAAYDLWASRTGHPTMSGTFGAGLRHPVVGPLLAAVVGGLAWHLLVEEVLPKRES